MNLKFILAKAFLIKETVEKMGFKNPRLHWPNEFPEKSGNCLRLLVDKNVLLKGTLPFYDGFLATKLSDILGCYIDVIVESNIRPLYKEDILNASLPLESTEHNLKQLYGVNDLKEVEYLEIDRQDQKLIRHFNQMLPRADRYIEKLATLNPQFSSHVTLERKFNYSFIEEKNLFTGDEKNLKVKDSLVKANKDEHMNAQRESHRMSKKRAIQKTTPTENESCLAKKLKFESNKSKGQSATQHAPKEKLDTIKTFFQTDKKEEKSQILFEEDKQKCNDFKKQNSFV